MNDETNNDELYDYEDIEQDADILEDEENEVLDELDEEKDIDSASKISELTKINADLIDKLQRTLAEFDNFRKRTQKEKSQMYDNGVRNTVEKILPVIDNFERAVNSFEKKDDNIYIGFSMILKQLNTILFDMGIDVIETVGAEFNTEYHNAVAHVSDDNYGPNEVIEELQRGYKYNDKVIRCSMVKVAN